MPSLKRFWILASFSVLAVIFTLNRSPFVSFHDSLSFLLDAETGFNPATNATSHLVYNNFQHLLLLCFPGQNPVFILTWLSVFSSIFALAIFRKLAEEFTGNWKASILSTLALGLSFSWWQQSEIIEVYSFNSFWVCGWLFLVFKDVQESSGKRLPLSFLFWAISILVHIQNILAFPLFVWYFYRSQVVFSRKILSAIIFLSCISVLFIFPLITQSNSISAIFFDRHFGKQFEDVGLSSLLKGTGLAIAFLFYNWHFLLILFLGGLFYLKNEKKEINWFLGLVFFPWFLFGLKFRVPDAHVFFITAWIIVALVLCKGISVFLEKRNKWFPILVIIFSFLSPSFYFLTSRAGKKLNYFKNYNIEKSYKGGSDHVFWPGKSNAIDPLKLCQEKMNSGESTDEIEWEFQSAKKILELRSKK